MPFILNLNKLSAKEADEYLYTHTRPLSSPIWTFPWSFIYSNPSVNFNTIWMIKHIDRPVACAWRVCGFFFSSLENKLCQQQTNGWTWERMRSGGTDVPDRPSVLCSILCLYSLKEYMVSVQVKYVELWTSREEVLSRPRHFFCTNGSFFLFFSFMFCDVNGVALGCWTYWK